MPEIDAKLLVVGKVEDGEENGAEDDLTEMAVSVDGKYTDEVKNRLEVVITSEYEGAIDDEEAGDGDVDRDGTATM